MSERITEERLVWSVYCGNVRMSTWDDKERAEQSAQALAYLNKPLEVVCQSDATARRERELAEQVRVLAKHVQDHHAVYDAGDNDDMGPLWDNLASSKNELDDMLTAHNTTLVKLAGIASAVGAGPCEQGDER